MQHRAGKPEESEDSGGLFVKLTWSERSVRTTDPVTGYPALLSADGIAVTSYDANRVLDQQWVACGQDDLNLAGGMRVLAEISRALRELPAKAIEAMLVDLTATSEYDQEA